MQDQCLTPEALGLSPTCVRCIATDADQLDDSVHRFVRLMACYELVLKLLASASHAVHVEAGPSERYTATFRARFVEKRPALGDWYWILEDTSKSLSRSGPPWLAPCLRWLLDEARKDSAISRLGRCVGLARKSLPTEGPNQPYSGFSCLARVVELRNAFGHGALTPRFAERYNALLSDALEEYVRGLSLATTWRFLVPLRYDPGDARLVIVMDPESPDTRPRSIPLGERATKPEWRSLYVGASSESFEDAVGLGPVIRYERTLRDYFFLNTFDADEVEYLSYRSGDFDFQHAAGDWAQFFGIAIAAPAPASQPDGATPPLPPPQPEAPAAVEQKAPPVPALESTGQAAPVSQHGPSVRDLVASFTELGQRSHPPQWGQTLDEWEVLLSPLSDDVLAQLFVEMRNVATSATSSFSLLLFLGNLQQRLGFHEEAVRQLESLSNGDPDNRDLKSRYGCALLLWGNQLKMDGKAQHNGRLIGQGKSVLGDAKKALAESLYHQPTSKAEVWHNVRALSMLVDACCRRGEFEEAAGYCDEGLKLEPGNQRLNSQRLFIHETLSRRTEVSDSVLPGPPRPGSG